MATNNKKVYAMPEQKASKQKQNVSVSSKFGDALNTELKQLRSEDKRSFEAAEFGRLQGDWRGELTHVNDRARQAMRILRARARELEQNNPHVQQFFQLLETNLIGPDGFIFKSKAGDWTPQGFVLDTVANEIIQRHWSTFCERGVCDITGRQSFKQMLNLLIRTAARDGEALLINHKVKPTKKNPYGFALQITEVDRLDIDYNVPTNKEGISIIMGVEQDQYGKPLAYHFNELNNTQLTSNNKKTRTRIDADSVYHIYIMERAEQVRGITWLHSVMKPLHQLQSFEDYTLVAARIGASKMGFFKRNADATTGAEALSDGVDEQGDLIMEAEPGQFGILPEGWDFVSYSPEYPASTYADFTKSIKRSVANGLKLCYNTMFGDLEAVNYSSIRQALIAERDMYKALQAWLTDVLLEPLFEDWLLEAFKNNAITSGVNGFALPIAKIDKYLADYSFKGRAWSWVDPRNDLEAAKIAKDIGIYSPTRIAEMMGEDIYQAMAETAAVRDEAERLNIYMDNVNDPAAKLLAAQTAANILANNAGQAATQAQASKAIDAQRDMFDTMRSEVRSVALQVADVKNAPKGEAPSVTLNPSNVTVEAPQVNVHMSSRKTMKTVPVRDERGLIVSIDTVVEELTDEPVQEVQEPIQYPALEPLTPVEEVSTPEAVQEPVTEPLQEEVKPEDVVVTSEEIIELYANVIDEFEEKQE